MKNSRKSEYPKVYKTKEEAVEAKNSRAREFLKTVDLSQLDELIARNRQSK